MSQKHISEKVGTSYPSSKATDLRREAQHLGYGEIFEQTSSNRRRISIFRKRHYEELSEDCQAELKKVKISRLEYEKSFEAVTDQLNYED